MAQFRVLEANEVEGFTRRANPVSKVDLTLYKDGVTAAINSGGFIGFEFGDDTQRTFKRRTTIAAKSLGFKAYFLDGNVLKVKSLDLIKTRKPRNTTNTEWAAAEVKEAPKTKQPSQARSKATAVPKPRGKKEKSWLSGSSLRDMRLAKELTLSELSAKSGVGEADLHAVEKGVRLLTTVEAERVLQALKAA